MKKYQAAILFFISILILGGFTVTNADDGSKLWLRYNQIDDKNLIKEYRSIIQEIVLQGDSPTVSVIRTEMKKEIGGELFNYEHTGIAGVANTGTDRNWTGHPFGQAYWYVLGRMAWDPTRSD